MSQDGHQANLLERGIKKVNVLYSEDVSETLCKFLKLQASPEVDMESFDGNVLTITISWPCSRKLLKVS